MSIIKKVYKVLSFEIEIMSTRTLFNLFNESKKNTKMIEEDTKFERRVAISHSGRWKQKNRHRLSIRNEDFLYPTCELPNKEDGTTIQTTDYADNSNITRSCLTNNNTENSKNNTSHTNWTVDGSTNQKIIFETSM